MTCPVFQLIHDERGRDITTFLHLDRGEELVDHHCFFFFEGPKYHVHHSSYETYDFDTQLIGHDWLRDKGYENCWGVGRHIMGSQIFDYWFDPSRFIFEHYVDGDFVNSSYETNKCQASPGNLHVWGTWRNSRRRKGVAFRAYLETNFAFRSRRSPRFLGLGYTIQVSRSTEWVPMVVC